MALPARLMNRRTFTFRPPVTTACMIDADNSASSAIRHVSAIATSLRLVADVLSHHYQQVTEGAGRVVGRAGVETLLPRRSDPSGRPAHLPLGRRLQASIRSL